MRILVIGAGGVGSAAVGIADRRAFFEHMVVADYDPARVDAALAQVSGDSRFVGRAGGRLRRERGRRADPRAQDHARPQRGRPAVRDADLRRAASPPAPTYLDMAMSLSPAAPRAAVRADRREARRRAVREGRGVGGDGPARARRAWASSPGLSDVFARYAADHLFSEIDEVGRARRREPRPSTATTSRRRSRSGRRSRSASTRRSCGRRTAAGSRRRRSASPRCSTSRRASARSSASTSSTRRCSSSRAG